MPSYPTTGYGALNGLRSNLYGTTASSSSVGRARPVAGLNPPTIAYKSSPFYDQKYQVGDVRALEGAYEGYPSSSAPLIRNAN